MANGIEISKDGKLVAVVASLDRQIILYETNSLDLFAQLNEKKRIETRSSCDNLIWADATHLLSGCHPKPFDFISHSKNPQKNKAPCEVVRVSTNTDEESTVETLFLDNIGDFFSACSVASIASDGALLIGAVHDYGILRCENWERGVKLQSETRSVNY